MSRRPGPPDDVFFPVVPMLDMSFQLLAFFIMTFQPPSGETRLDLVLPAAPVALPRGTPAAADAPDAVGLETDLVVEATADAGGELARLALAGGTLADPEALRERLARYVAVVAPRPVRVVLRADDALRYEVGARLIAACTTAGVGSVRLTGPSR
jgi:biopolymer transport protein ExbD